MLQRNLISALLALVTTVMGISIPQSADAADFSVKTVSAPAHTGQLTLVFEVGGAIATKFANCNDLVSTLRPVVMVTDDQGTSTLLVAAPWGQTVKTLMVLTDGLRCEIETAERDTYQFALAQESVSQTFELIFGIFKAAGSTTMLNKNLLIPAKPQILSPTRGSTVGNVIQVALTDPFDSKFQVTSRRVEICVEACVGNSNIGVYNFDNPTKAYVAFEADEFATKPLQILVTWTYKNPSGATNWVTNSVMVNAASVPTNSVVPLNVVRLFKSNALSTNFTCAPIQKSQAKTTCSITPTFSTVRLSAQASFEIQKSFDGKAWSRVVQKKLLTNKRFSFVVPINKSKKVNYFRVVSKDLGLVDFPIFMLKGYVY